MSAPVQVQKSWMYLEPILSAPDIQKQLPAESKAFDRVHKQLKEVMRRTKDRPNALQTASNPSESCGCDQAARGGVHTELSDGLPDGFQQASS